MTQRVTLARYMPDKLLKQVFEVGQAVKLTGAHSFAGHTGRIVRFEKLKLLGGKERPVVEIHDMCGHEVFVVSDADAKVIDG